MKNKLQIARRYALAAEHRRAEAAHYMSAYASDVRGGTYRACEYDRLMFLVGFHTIQAELWIKSAKEFGNA